MLRTDILPRRIADAVQDGGERVRLGERPVEAVVAQRAAPLDTAGDQRRAAWRRDGSGRVVRRQNDTLVCETVEARSAKSCEDIRPLVASEADVAKSEVVCQDKDDVRSRASNRGDWRDGQSRNDGDNSKCLLHGLI